MLKYANDSKELLTRRSSRQPTLRHVGFGKTLCRVSCAFYRCFCTMRHSSSYRSSNRRASEKEKNVRYKHKYSQLLVRQRSPCNNNNTHGKSRLLSEVYFAASVGPLSMQITGKTNGHDTVRFFLLPLSAHAVFCSRLSNNKEMRKRLTF